MVIFGKFEKKFEKTMKKKIWKRKFEKGSLKKEIQKKENKKEIWQRKFKKGNLKKENLIKEKKITYFCIYLGKVENSMKIQWIFNENEMKRKLKGN